MGGKARREKCESEMEDPREFRVSVENFQFFANYGKTTSEIEKMVRRSFEEDEKAKKMAQEKLKLVIRYPKYLG